MTPKIAYGWQPIGEQWSIPAYKDKVLNVFGLHNPITNHLISYILPKKSYMSSELFIKYMNDFVSKITKPTAVVIDQAPWHTSERTLSKLEQWSS